VNLLGANIDTVEKNTKTLIDASKKIGQEMNTEETKYVLLSCPQNAGQNLNIKIANTLFKNVAWCRYFGMTLINRNLLQEKLRGY
jgi:hypothetical protein